MFCLAETGRHRILLVTSTLGEAANLMATTDAKCLFFFHHA